MNKNKLYRVYAWHDMLGLNLLAGKDIGECAQQLQKKDNQFWRRTYYRTSFAYIEAILNSMKAYIYHTCDDKGVILPPEEQLFLNDLVPYVKKNGEISTQTLFCGFKQMIRSTLYLYQSYLTESHKVNFSANGWNSLQNALEIRNRITHPKNPQHLEISEKEIQNLKDGLNWFMEELQKLYESSAKQIES